MIFSIIERKKYLYGASKIIFSQLMFLTSLWHTGDNFNWRFRRHFGGRGLIFFFTGNGLVTKVFEVTISIFASSNFNFSLAGSTTYALRMQCICGWAVQRMYHRSNLGSLLYWACILWSPMSSLKLHHFLTLSTTWTEIERLCSVLSEQSSATCPDRKNRGTERSAFLGVLFLFVCGQ